MNLRATPTGATSIPGTSIFGTSVRRVEDPGFITGASRYTGDIELPGLCHVSFVRSTVAHARILGVDTAAAEKLPGVLAVFSGEGFPIAPINMMGALGVPAAMARPVLAIDTVRFVGELIAAVVAETAEQAHDAAEQIVVDYERLPVVVDVESALDDGAPLLFPELGTNRATVMPAVADTDLFADADVVVTARFVNQRIAVMPMEPWALTIDPGPKVGAPAPDPDGVITVWASTQSAHGVRGSLAGAAGLAPKRIRVIAPAVGGGFGAKGGADMEFHVVLHAARQLGRPVRWLQSRSENLVGMHARAQVQHVELGARRDGTFTALRAHVIADGGAYPAINCFLAMMTRLMAPGVYRIPRVECSTTTVATNTAVLTAFRGAGRPEAAAMIERIVDMMAAELAIDPAELRRHNLIESFPHTTPTGAVYDSGDYEATLDAALAAAGYGELRAEQALRRQEGSPVVLGIGVSTYVEVTAANGGTEFAGVSMRPDAEVPGGVAVTVRSGASSHGQGHATSFAQIAAAALDVPFEAVTIVQGDTAAVERGVGTFASRSTQIGGSSVHEASRQVVDQARRLAAHVLEAPEVDVETLSGGRFAVRGVPARAVTWSDLARHDAEALAATSDFVQRGSTFPFGAHVAVVEVDVETGAVTLVRHIAVDDCGTIVNPLLVTGQQHGGIASGIAQALFEEMVYDADGNPLTASLVDYSMPSAAELPSFETSNTETPTPLNPLGAKGIGESGTIGSMPAVHNAVVDALAHLGVRHIDMPCTPNKVWHAIRNAAEATASANASAGTPSSAPTS